LVVLVGVGGGGGGAALTILAALWRVLFRVLGPSQLTLVSAAQIVHAGKWAVCTGGLAHACVFVGKAADGVRRGEAARDECRSGLRGEATSERSLYKWTFTQGISIKWTTVMHAKNELLRKEECERSLKMEMATLGSPQRSHHWAQGRVGWRHASQMQIYTCMHAQHSRSQHADMVRPCPQTQAVSNLNAGQREHGSSGQSAVGGTRHRACCTLPSHVR